MCVWEGGLKRKAAEAEAEAAIAREENVEAVRQVTGRTSYRQRNDAGQPACHGQAVACTAGGDDGIGLKVESRAWRRCATPTIVV